jgi:hypothetical protein
MIDLLRVLAYPLPGLALLALAMAGRRVTRDALDMLAGTEPVWARRWARLAVVLLGAAGLALLGLGGALAWIVLRTPA